MSESRVWPSRRARIKNLLLVFALALICFVPLWGFVLFAPRFILYFPAGLLWILSKIGLIASADGNEALIAAMAIVVWLLLFAISATIVISNQVNLVRRLFVVLIIVLMLNLVGWYSLFISRIT